MSTVHIAPLAGKLVRDPKSYEVLPPEGKRVELNSYWQRRISMGDCEIVGAKKASGKTKANSKEA